VKALLDIALRLGDRPDLLETPEVREYIRLYGDRCPHELKLESMTYRERPALLEAQIRAYAADKGKLAAMIEGLQTRKAIKKGFLARRAQLGIRNREVSRLNRSGIYGMVRRVFIAIGKQVFGEGWFDIFYLTIEEIAAGRFDRALVDARKREYAAYEKKGGYTRVALRDGEPVKAETAGGWTRSFAGVGTSQGACEGVAVVVDDPGGGADVKDKIIVTKTTDPGWVFLLCQAKGIVAEKGSLLSHTAIVSRELGIPSVVGVENATSVIKTGDILRIDGADGRVEIVAAG